MEVINLSHVSRLNCYFQKYFTLNILLLKKIQSPKVEKTENLFRILHILLKTCSVCSFPLLSYSQPKTVINIASTSYRNVMSYGDRAC